MRQEIFNTIIAMLGGCSKLQGEDGTLRVYDYPQTSPAGYPYGVVGSESLDSAVLDNASDMRLYKFRIQIVGEKFGDTGGMTQSDALSAMRETEDAVLSIFDNKNSLGLGFVTRSMPTHASYDIVDGGGRVVLTIDMAVDVRILITN